MDYNLAVVLILVLYFIFVYQVGIDAEQYCMADNTQDSRIAYYGMIASGFLAILFLTWAFYEYSIRNDMIKEIKESSEKQKEEQKRLDYINAPDPNIVSALKRTNVQNPVLSSTSSTNPTITTNPANLTSPTSPANLTSTTNPISPTPNLGISDYDKFYTINADPSIGEITKPY
jgi:hypothetical protein